MQQPQRKARDALVFIRAGKLRLPVLEREKVHLVLNYGADCNLPPIAPPETPLTIEESLLHAADFVTDLGRRGYPVMEGVDPKHPRSMYDRSLQIVNRRRAKQRLALKVDPNASEPPNDASQDVREFLDAHAVHEIEGEFRKLPFFVKGNDTIIIEKFRQDIAAMARRMVAARLFDVRRLNRLKIVQSTMKFVESARKIRQDVMRWCFDAGYVDLALVAPNSTLRAEFPEFWPPPPVESDPFAISRRPADCKIDRRAADFLESVAPDLPRPYQVSRASLEHSHLPPPGVILQTVAASIEEQALRRRPPVVASPRPPPRMKSPPEVITASRGAMAIAPRTVVAPLPPPPPPPPPRLLDVATSYWRSDDPLADTRTGAYVDPLATMGHMARSVGVTIPEVVDSPFTLWQLPEADVKNSEGESEAPETGAVPESLPRPGRLTRLRCERASFKRSLYVSELRAASAISYLEAHTDDFEPDTRSDAIYTQFEKLFSLLGFSVKQKLDMVLKYSRSPEVSVKLSEALVTWQKAYECVTVYQDKYLLMKEFLRVGIKVYPPEKRPRIYLDYERELLDAERMLRDIAERLRIGYEDELMFKRHPVAQVIEARRVKIAQLRKEAVVGATDASTRK
jgi:hypothetical protein